MLHTNLGKLLEEHSFSGTASCNVEQSIRHLSILQRSPLWMIDSYAFEAQYPQRIKVISSPTVSFEQNSCF